MTLSDTELDTLIQLITQRTGIIPRASHRDGIRSYIEKKLSELGMDCASYKTLLLASHDVFAELVNESTVNETYFFREERQFAFIRDKLFPLWQAQFGSAPIKMWSAACSYGEEAYSLALLAKACHVRAEIIASDINTLVLEHCRKGEFLASSMRHVDGAAFQHLLLPYRTQDGKVVFTAELCNTITTRKINLAAIDAPSMDTVLPQQQNIVFLRNVFIYFDQDLRARILRTIADKCLCTGGYLFVSMSEIAQLDASLMPKSFEKIVDGNVFYFHKKAED